MLGDPRDSFPHNFFFFLVDTCASDVLLSWKKFHHEKKTSTKLSIYNVQVM